MNDFLTYVFYPNPGDATYGSPSMIALFLLCGGLIALSFGIKYWRGTLRNAVTKKLSRSWPSISFWFGLVGLVLAVSRVERIQFVAMRFLWALWLLALLFAVFVQWRLFRARHYEVLPRKEAAVDPRKKYIP